MAENEMKDFFKHISYEDGFLTLLTILIFVILIVLLSNGNTETVTTEEQTNLPSFFAGEISTDDMCWDCHIFHVRVPAGGGVDFGD